MSASAFSKLRPDVRDDVQRVLDRAARRLLAERIAGGEQEEGRAASVRLHVNDEAPCDLRIKERPSSSSQPVREGS